MTNAPVEVKLQPGYVWVETGGGTNSTIGSGGYSYVAPYVITITIGSQLSPGQSFAIRGWIGQVTLTMQTGEPIQLQFGAKFFLGSILETGSNGYATVGLADGSGVTVGPSTSIYLQTITDFILQKGQAFLNFLEDHLGYRIVVGRDAVIAVRGAEATVQLTPSGNLTVADLEGNMQVVDLVSGSSVILNATQQITASPSGGETQQAMQKSVSSFDPAKVTQWWLAVQSTSTSSATSSAASSSSTAASSATSTSSSATSSASTASSTSTTATSTSRASPSSTSTTVASSTTTRSASTTSSATGGGGIPELPYQAVAVAALTLIVVASYVLVRRRS